MTRALMGLAVACLACAGTPARAADATLWRGARFGACQLELTHEQGGVRVERARGAARLEGDATRWDVAETRDDSGRRRLRVSARKDVAPADVPPLTLRVPATCQVAVHTLDGAISIHGQHRAPISAETRTGDIDLAVEPDAGLALDLATSGNLTIDFPVELDYRRHDEPAKRGRIAIGDSDVAVRLVSRRGAVRILEARRYEGRARR